MSMVPLAKAPCFADARAIVEGKADETTLARVVLECLMISRLTESKPLRRAFVSLAQQMLFAWKGERSPVVTSLMKQARDAGDAIC